MILKEKAIKIAEELNIEYFGGRNDRLETFKTGVAFPLKKLQGISSWWWI